MYYVYKQPNGQLFLVSARRRTYLPLNKAYSNIRHVINNLSAGAGHIYFFFRNAKWINTISKNSHPELFI